MNNFVMKITTPLQIKERAHCNLKNDHYGPIPISIKVPNKDDIQYPQRKDNFQITLNGSDGFLLNTSVSVTVDFNRHVHHNSSEENSDDNAYKTMPLEDCTHRVSQYLNLQDHCPTSADPIIEHSDAPRSLEPAAIYEDSSSRKRDLSPNKMTSPSKRKKLYTPQRNKIVRYLIRTDSPKRKSNERNMGLTYASIPVTSRVKYENDIYIKSYNEIESLGGNPLVLPKRTSLSEVINISSDEEGDSSNIVSGIHEEKKDEDVSSLANSLSAINCDFKDKNNKETDSYASRDSDCSASQMSDGDKKKHNIQEIFIISSDEDEYICASSQSEIIDLTYNSSHGNDDLHEEKQCQKDTLSEGQCILETRNSGDVTREGRRKDKSTTEDSSEHSHYQSSTSKESSSDTFSSDILSEDNSDSQLLLSPVSRHENEHNLELYDSKSGHASPNSSESNRNSRTSLLEQEDNTSDSSLPSPPYLGSEVHDLPTLLSSVQVRNETINKGNCIKVNSVLTDISEVVRCTDAICEFLDSNDSSTEICSEISDDENLTDFDSALKNNDRNPNAQFPKKHVICEGTCGSSPQKTVHPSAERVCQVQAEVLMSKLYQPWVDLGSHCIPECCIKGPDECNRLHAKKQDLPEELKYHDDIFIVRIQSLTSAIDFVHHRINNGHHPTPAVVQYLILSAVGCWKEVARVVLCLRNLLRVHPPCVSGMLDYYKKTFFSPVQKMGAPDGIFWWCVNKINEVMNAITEETTNEKPDDKTNMNKDYMHPSPSFPNVEITEVPYPKMLEELFNVLEILISMMEADLNVGLIKNMNNLKRYTSKSGRPLIAVALWGSHGISGPVNAKCKELMKMYFVIFKSYYDKYYLQYFRRLISLMAGVVHASERNTQPPKYPNVGLHCREFTNAFSSVMMASALNMVEAWTVLKFLKPDWFRFCVCSNLVEKLYGRNMDMSLQPTIALLKNLVATNQHFPSQEEMSHTMLGETASDCVVINNSEELSPNFVKNATKKDTKGETRLHIACRRNHVSQLERLLSVPNINVNEKDNMGWTPLHEAALHGSTECVKLLLNFRTPAGGPAVDLHIKNSCGVTPLMDAVSRDRLEIAFQLLQHGGPELLLDKNDEDKSPFDLAHTEEMKNILKNTPDESIYNGFVAIPRTLYIKLAVLTPLAIFFYVSFSEVLKISSHLKNNVELKSHGKSPIKFRPVSFKQDYFDIKALQTVLRKMSKCNSELLEQMVFLL